MPLPTRTHLVLIIIWSIQTATVELEFGWAGALYSVAYKIQSVFVGFEMFLVVWVHVFVFLALFYMAHALTLLRTGSEPDSSAFRKGRGFALGSSIFVAVLSFTSFCLYMSTAFVRRSDDRDGWSMRRLIAGIFQIVCQSFLICMAIGSVVYSAKSRKKALGTAVEKVCWESLESSTTISGVDKTRFQAGTVLVWCSSLFLVRQVWEMLSFFFGGRVVSFWYPTFFVDLFAGSYLTFVILVLLFVAATKASYSMSKMRYRAKRSSENLEA